LENEILNWGIFGSQQELRRIHWYLVTNNIKVAGIFEVSLKNKIKLFNVYSWFKKIYVIEFATTEPRYENILLEFGLVKVF
jgi:hypothetical protein